MSDPYFDVAQFWHTRCRSYEQQVKDLTILLTAKEAEIERLKPKPYEPDKGWECATSPTGHCVYDKGDYEHCDHCGEPDERK